MDGMIEDLSADGFVRLPGVEVPSGVYCLLRRGEVVYVGKSKSVLHRVSQHRAKRDGPEKSRARQRLWASAGDATAFDIRFDDVWVLFCELRDLERLELEYIDRFKPRWNIQIREPLPKHRIDIHALAAQMKWDLRKDIPRRRGL